MQLDSNMSSVVSSKMPDWAITDVMHGSYQSKNCGLNQFQFLLFVVNYKDKQFLNYSPVNPVLRSASFHGTRELTASSSEEEEEEVALSAEDEDWPILQAPRVFSQFLTPTLLAQDQILNCSIHKIKFNIRLSIVSILLQ